MSNQVDQEKLQAETMPSEEVRRFLLTEMEASKQTLIELSDEQLAEIAGGLTENGKALIKELVCTACSGVGAAVAGYVGHQLGGAPAGIIAILSGGRIGHGVAQNVMEKIFPSPPENQTAHSVTASHPEISDRDINLPETFIRSPRPR